MAFREPVGFAPVKTSKPPKKARKAASKRKSKPKARPARRRVAVVGGVSKAAKKPPIKEKKTMARKRKRSPAQIAATKRMLAARKAKSGTTKKPAKRRAKARKAPAVKKHKDGSTSLTVTGQRKLPTAARTYAKRVRSQTTGSRGKKRTTTYRTYKSGKTGVIIRQNPANQTKAIVSSVVGFAVGIGAADILDRYVATRENGTGINAKSNGTRIFAQAAGTGVAAVGAYLLRKKSVVATYVLGGMAAGFAAKGVALLMKDYLLPALLDSGKSSNETIKSLGYGTVYGPRSLRPFQGKPTTIGPQATGRVGCGCSRVPVNVSDYSGRSDGREHCRPWPFDKSSTRECVERISERQPVVPAPGREPPRAKYPSIPQIPIDRIRLPNVPVGPDGYPIGPDGGYAEGEVVQPGGFVPPRIAIDFAGDNYPHTQHLKPQENRINYRGWDRSLPGRVKGPSQFRFPGR